jgi:four helix bundle protein
MREQGLEGLEVWKMAKAFAISVYQAAIPCLPQEEKWGLSQQLRRASQSIPANIAEGYGRYYYLENIRYCYIARGSLEETFSHLILAHELGYLPNEIFDHLNEKYRNLLRLLNGYIAYLRKGKRGEGELGTHDVRDFTDESYFLDPTENDSD